MKTVAPWVVLLLLLSAVTINYIDRGGLSVAAPVIQKEFALSPAQLGWLLSAFFWSYSLFQILAGWLVDRLNVKWVYGSAFLIWSLAMAATGFVTSFQGLLVMRLVLGVGESVNYPACISILSRIFPEERRGFATGLVDAGSKIGPALSTLLGGLAVGKWGWRGLFVGVGLASLLWLLPWLLWMPTPPVTPATQQLQAPGWRQILRRREAWGTSLGMFALGYVWVFLMSWLPSYLVNERHFSMAAMATLGSLPFWGMAATSIGGGWLSDWCIRQGGSPTRVRKTFVITGLLLCAGFMTPAVLVTDSSTCVRLLAAAALSLGIFTSNVWAVTQTLAGPVAAGKWAGLQNCIGNLGGVVSPALTGLVVQRTHSFVLAFAAASVVLLLGIVAYITLVPVISPVKWEEEP